MTSTTVAVSLAIVAALTLVIGTAIAIWLDVVYRQEVEQEKNANLKQTSIEEGSNNDALEAANKETPPLLFPTVSAATARFASWPYNVFVITTSLHGSLIQVFNFWLLDKFTSPEVVGGDVEVLAHCATVGLVVAVVFLWLMSLIPAKGRGTIPHITCGMVYFQSGICWMFWMCMLTRRSDVIAHGWLIPQVILCSVSILASIWAFYFVRRTMKLYEKGTREWKLSLHKGACGQFTFGVCYAIFIIVTAVAVA